MKQVGAMTFRGPYAQRAGNFVKQKVSTKSLSATREILRKIFRFFLSHSALHPLSISE